MIEIKYFNKNIVTVKNVGRVQNYPLNEQIT